MDQSSSIDSELHERKEQCQKNPGHLDFIPAHKFTMEHLPEQWHDMLVLDFITALINLTVRLAVTYTSKYRPQDYLLNERRGQHGVTTYGSGWVYGASRKFTKKDNHTCPCETCKQSPDQAKKQWGEIWVRTACHMVYDSSEARHTKCDLFLYSDKDMYNYSSLEGVKVFTSNMERDHCDMICITHDEDVYNKMRAIIDHYDDLQYKLRDGYERSGHVDKKKTAVVISHPHGLGKYVTVKQCAGRQESLRQKWTYSGEICPGSSGAPICFLGDWDKVQRASGLDYSIYR